MLNFPTVAAAAVSLSAAAALADSQFTPMDKDILAEMEEQLQELEDVAAEKSKYEFAFSKAWGNKRLLQTAIATSGKWQPETHAYRFDFSSDLTAFRRKANIVGVESSLSVDSAETYGKLMVLGQTKWQFIGHPKLEKDYNVTREFDQGQQVMVGPVPVTMSLSVAAAVGMKLSAENEQVGTLTGKITPYVNAVGSASAKTGAFSAEASGTGTVTLLNTTIESRADLSIDQDAEGRFATANLKTRHRMSVLDGNIVLDAKVGEKRWSREIFKWQGFHRDWIMAEDSYTTRL